MYYVYFICINLNFFVHICSVLLLLACPSSVKQFVNINVCTAAWQSRTSGSHRSLPLLYLKKFIYCIFEFKTHML